MSLLIEKLCRKESLSIEESMQVFSRTVKGDMDSAELAGFLIALRCKGEDANEIVGAATALLSAAEPFATPDYDFIDCCGTGGDGFATLNVSTATAFVLASLGVPVAKHGNRAVSSQSGSTDVLKVLGIPVDQTAEISRQLLDKHNLCFLHAPQYHPGVKHAMPVRQSLKVRTVFNLLGPIINPARPNLRLIGLYDARYLSLVAQTLKSLGVERALVVNGQVDEIAVHGETQVCELDQGEIRQYSIQPSNLGLPTYALKDIAGADPEFNANALVEALNGQGSEAYRAAIAANAAAGLYLAQQVSSLKSGVESVMAALSDGVCARFLNEYQHEVRRAS